MNQRSEAGDARVAVGGGAAAPTAGAQVLVPSPHLHASSASAWHTPHPPASVSPASAAVDQTTRSDVGGHSSPVPAMQLSVSSSAIRPLRLSSGGSHNGERCFLTYH